MSVSRWHCVHVQATFSVKKGSEAFKPQQVMLVLTSEETGVAAYAIGKAKRDAYTITINAAAVEKQLGKQVRRQCMRQCTSMAMRDDSMRLAA